jgi:hypothetical protein
LEVRRTSPAHLEGAAHVVPNCPPFPSVLHSVHFWEEDDELLCA